MMVSSGSGSFSYWFQEEHHSVFGAGKLATSGRTATYNTVTPVGGSDTQVKIVSVLTLL